MTAMQTLQTPALLLVMATAAVLPPSPTMVSVTEPACRPAFCQIAKVRCQRPDGTVHVCCRNLPECPHPDKPHP